MKRKLLLTISIIVCTLLEVITTQYNQPVFGGMQQGFQYFPYKNVANPFQLYPNQEYVNNKWNVQENLNYEQYNDYTDENTCSCDNCDDLKPACKNICPNCASTPSPLPAPGYVFLPYPYPYPMTTKTTTIPKQTTKYVVTTTVTSTTEVSTQKSTKRVELAVEDKTDMVLTEKIDDSKVPDIITKSFHVKDKSPYILTSLRRTKPNWIPKYGIVPISDQFAEKLMLQLRTMKVLHPRKDNLRDIDEITPLN